MAEIRHYLVIHAPVEKVYRAISEQSGLAAWWTDDVVAEPKINSVAEFNFDEKYHNEMVVTELTENQQIKWRCQVGDPEWIDTTFSFDLEKKDADTILRFSHGNWREATDFYASCNYHWGYYLGSLKKYCEEGKGYPFISKKKS